jgi:Peptidase family S41
MVVSGGNAYVQYELLTSHNSIFQKSSSWLLPLLETTQPSHNNNRHGTWRDSYSSRRDDDQNVGYIRLTRFSRASTRAFMDAIQVLEDFGTTRYIIDVRNNYGGVIQEAMLLASSLLRDPHMVLCYTMNSRGGLTPHDVEEYVMDTRYPGYLLSYESDKATIRQVQREHPAWFRSNSKEEWLPMSSFANLREQHVKRGIHRPGLIVAHHDNSYDRTPYSAAMAANAGLSPFWDMFRSIASSSSSERSISSSEMMIQLQQLAAQKNIVIMINEGTASSAEVFASALHDNGRTVALVGTKTYGKGLVQHTFPTPDGGGLRLTVVEYLTPALHHVSHVGGAQYDRATGEYIGGGIQPDIYCDSRHGIPSNIGSDLCVGVAMDALNEADSAYRSSGQLSVKRMGGVDDGSKARRAVTIGILKVSCVGFNLPVDLKHEYSGEQLATKILDTATNPSHITARCFNQDDF